MSTDTDVITEDPEREVTEDVPATPPRRRRLRAWATVVVVLLTAAGIGWLGYVRYQDRQTEQLRGQLVSAVHDYLVAMSAFDYQHMDAHRNQITTAATTEFAHKYDQMVAALRDIVVSSKGVATATADHVAVEHLDGHSATVIGFVDQHVINVTAPQGSDQRYRMVVSLTRDGDRWLVTDVQTI